MTPFKVQQDCLCVEGKLFHTGDGAYMEQVSEEHLKATWTGRWIRKVLMIWEVAGKWNQFS